jgi:hypothetical protein
MPAAAAVVVTVASVAIVVIPATRTILPAGTAVVTVESVRVATPTGVPEVAWAPLREWPRLGLRQGSCS